MGLLSLFSRNGNRELMRLPSGSLTIDRKGNVLTSTLPRSFPQVRIDKIASEVLAAFRAAHQAEICFSELIVDYPALKLTARELKGGAIIFLSPLASR
jgi:hypothetical protein